jgi:sn-1 stearoyl-lipid 9-desaturase
MANQVLERDTETINWSTITAVAVFHILAAAALFTAWNWQDVAAALVMWWIAGSFGIGIGYHRLMTHRGFKTSRTFERLLAVAGTLAVQSGPVTWVTTHRLHHAFTETDQDPHSPRRGTYWSHMGWIFRGTAQNNGPEVEKRYSPDLVRDPFLVVLDRFYWVPTVFAGAVLMLIGGLPMLLWGIFLRTVVGWHTTWLVNSATHLWGTRRFETRDDSRNNALIAAATFGEGWHNNHHAHPRSARHGIAWYEFDVNWLQIKLFEKLRLVKDVYAYELRPRENDEVVELIPAQDPV